MLSGTLPFVGPTPLLTALKRLLEPPPPLRDRVRDLDPRIDRLIARCLAREATERFEDAAELLAALSEAGGTSTSSAGESAACESAAPPGAAVREAAAPAPRPLAVPARRPTLRAIGLGVALAAAALACALVVFHGQPVSRLPDGAVSSDGRRLPSRRSGLSGDGAAVSPRPAWDAAVQASGPRRAVAVLSLRSLTGREEDSWLAVGLAEMLTTELALGDGLRVASGETVGRVQRELGLAEGQEWRSDALVRMAGGLHVDLLVTGTYAAVGEPGARQLRIDLALANPASGERVASFAASGSEADLFGLVSRLGSGLRQRLGERPLLVAEGTMVRATLPADHRAARAYSEGVRLVRGGDARAGRKLLEQAVALAPRHALSRAALAGAMYSLGYEQRAAKEAQRALELAASPGASLGESDRLRIEARLHEVSGNTRQAVALYRSLSDSFPDDIGAALWLAAAQMNAGQGKDALRTLETLRQRLPSQAAADPQVDCLTGQVNLLLGDMAAAQRSFGRAAALAERHGARLTLAQALVGQAAVLSNLGQTQQALRTAEEAERASRSAGYADGVAQALVTQGTVRRALGSPVAARSAYLRALEIDRASGSLTGAARALDLLSNLVSAEGDLDEAERMAKECLTLRREVGRPQLIARALARLGSVRCAQGRLAEAAALQEEAIALFRSLGTSLTMAYVICDLAWTRLLLGELDAVESLAREALATSQREGTGPLTAAALLLQGESAVDRGKFAAARTYYQRALAENERAGEKRSAAIVRLGLARLALEEGKTQEAEAAARAVVAELVKLQAKNDELVARALLARVLLMEDRAAEARAALGRAEQLARGTQDAWN